MDKEYMNGIYAKKPHEKAPRFVIARCSINLDRFIEWAGDKVNEAGYINFDMLEQKNDSSKFSFVLDTYKKGNPVPAPDANDYKVSEMSKQDRAALEEMSEQELPF